VLVRLLGGNKGRGAQDMVGLSMGDSKQAFYENEPCYYFH